MAHYSPAWQQFLIGRRNILAQYEAALAHAKEQPVVTHHGNVGEAAVRDWLATFLPKRFAVTSGYIQRQGFEDRHLSGNRPACPGMPLAGGGDPEHPMLGLERAWTSVTRDSAGRRDASV